MYRGGGREVERGRKEQRRGRGTIYRKVGRRTGRLDGNAGLSIIRRPLSILTSSHFIERSSPAFVTNSTGGKWSSSATRMLVPAPFLTAHPDHPHRPRARPTPLALRTIQAQGLYIVPLSLRLRLTSALIERHENQRKRGPWRLKGSVEASLRSCGPSDSDEVADRGRR